MPSPKSFTLDQFAAHGVQVSPRWLTDPHLRQQLAGRWRINPEGYVERSETGGGKTLLHRLIKGLAKGDPITVEHDNHNRLDNRDENLLLKTRSENAKGRKDPIPGLRFDHLRKQWFLRPNIQGKLTYLGRFHSREDASRRYDCAIRHGVRCECWKRPGAGAGKMPVTATKTPTALDAQVAKTAAWLADLARRTSTPPAVRMVYDPSWLTRVEQERRALYADPAEQERRQIQEAEIAAARKRLAEADARPAPEPEKPENVPDNVIPLRRAR